MINSKKIIPLAISTFITLLFFSCGKEDQKLLVAAAASTQFAIKELATKFEKENDITVEVITGASGKLTTQIINGAPYDIFFSANMKYPQVLFEKKKCTKAPVIYGYGVPVLWTLKEDLVLDKKGQLLLGKAVEKIAIANPKNAPYGVMAVQFMKDNNIYDSIESKLVFGESISLVNEYILNRTVTIGVGAKSIIMSPRINEKGTYLALGSDYWIKQGVVELTNTESSEMKTKFMKFIFSKEGDAIFEKFGYEKK